MTEVDLLPRFDLGSVPGRKSIRSPDVTRKQQLSLSSPKFGHKINFFQPDRDDSANNNNKEMLSDRLVLEVLEEDEETSDMERRCEGHLKKIQELEILVARGQTNLQQVNVSLVKVESDLSKMSEALEKSETKLCKMTKTVEEREEEIEKLKAVIEEKKTEETALKQRLEILSQKESSLKTDQEQDQSPLVDESQAVKVENRKIRDQLKLQVQERKLLLKKISMLKEQLGPVSDTKSDIDCKNKNLSKNLKESRRVSRDIIPNMEHGVQCDLGVPHALVDATSEAHVYKDIIVKLNKKLANATNACDTLRDQLEEILDTAEHVVEKGDIDKIKDVLEKSRSVSRNLSNDLNTGVQSEEDLNGSFMEERMENPLSDASTWNMELPNLADMQLCSSPDLLFERQGHRFDEQFPEDVCSNVIEHLSEQIEKRNTELAQKSNYITNIEDELAHKDDIIKDQSDTINEYREEILKLEENLYGPRYCPVMDQKHKEQEKRQRKRPLKKGDRKSKVKPLKMEAQALSVDSDSWSDPDRGVSLARIGLPNSFPEQTSKCSCENDILLSDSEENHATVSVYECSSNACLASGKRVLEGLVASLVHQVELCTSIDSGIETEEVIDQSRDFSLCAKCTSSIPKEFDETLKSVHSGVSSAVIGLGKVRLKIGQIWGENEALKMREKEALVNEEEAKSRLNENYILIAKLSSENLRLLGEYSKLETMVEELKKSSLAMELRLEDEICSLNGKLFDKEKELEKLQEKINEFENRSLDLKEKVEHLQNNSRQKCSPDTSSSFDFFPTSGLSPLSTSATFDSFRPRAFSACTQGPSAKHLSSKLTDVSSPDLGVDMESDPFSSLERGKSHRVGSLTFDRVVQENKVLRQDKEILRQDKEILTQKLGRSKTALQETLLRLSKSNMQKQDQVSPAVTRRPPSRLLSERAQTVEREPYTALEGNNSGAKPKINTSGKAKGAK